MGTCQSCQGLVQMHKHFQENLRKPLATGAGPGQKCPSDIEWMGVVAGQLSESREAILLEHAAGCDNCAAALRLAVQDLSDSISEEELALISSFRSAQPEWQHSLAQKLRIAHAREQEGSWPSVRALGTRIGGSIRLESTCLFEVLVGLRSRGNRAPCGDGSIDHAKAQRALD